MVTLISYAGLSSELFVIILSKLFLCTGYVVKHYLCKTATITGLFATKQ